MRVVEKFYAPSEIALLLGCDRTTIVRRLKAGDFGAEVVDLGKDGATHDYRIPASGVNAFLAQRRVFAEAADLGVTARSEGELRRKAKVQTPG